MNKISRDIFKAIYSGKWLEIEYMNKAGEVTCYWIGIKNIDTQHNMLIVDGFNVVTQKLAELKLYYSSICESNIVEDSCYNVNKELVKDIEENIYKYSEFFENTINLKILNYYEECCKLDNSPEKVTFGLIDELDIETIGESEYHLSARQFTAIIKKFHIDSKFQKSNKEGRKIQLSANICSINTNEGLYVLAYKPIYLDVVSRTLVKSPDITVCEEFTVDGNQYSIRKFIGEDNMYLLENMEENLDKIKEIITEENPEYDGVDDMPYIMAISRDINFNPEKEYAAILKSMKEDTASDPIKAFFGEIKRKPVRIKNYPLALYNEKVDMDQLRVIHDGIKYPLLYVQGPPGTGKTNTILNTVTTAFFNNSTVLISSYNNHPMDEIYEKLSTLKYNGRTIPFPIIRLGNNEKIEAAIHRIRELSLETENIKVFESTLDKKHADEKEEMNQLSEMLKRYEENQDAIEKYNIIRKMISSTKNLQLLSSLQGQQLKEIKDELDAYDFSNEDVEKYTHRDRTELLKYLFYASAKLIKRLREPKYKELYRIIFSEYENIEEQVLEFNQYLADSEKLRGFLRIFPIIVTTNISAHKLGEPDRHFDMVIMDEASQCSTAMALIPVQRGNQLMLVGDPQQLQPVILLDAKQNKLLRKKYKISDEYDYIHQSVYKTFLATDSVSDEVLLSHHYRCHPKIIEFNNKKYYNSKLKIESEDNNNEPLVFIDCQSSSIGLKNTNDFEAFEIINYIKENCDKSIGVVTPFVNQRKLINNVLKNNGMKKISCGTVHAFQGDEKQEIIFSLAITGRTGIGTYRWLKNNRELINVATSRAQEKLIILGNSREIRRLHQEQEKDDLFELCEYVKSGGTTYVSKITPESRALGIKPYDGKTEDTFLENLNYAVNSLSISKNKYDVLSNVDAVNVFRALIENGQIKDAPLTEEITNIFYEEVFDYVVYENLGKMNTPIFAIEIVNPSDYHKEDISEQRKDILCDKMDFRLIRVPNNYARRYNYIKDILTVMFKG